MCESIHITSVSDDHVGATVERLQLDAIAMVDASLVIAKGELDRASSDELVYVSTEGDHRDVFLDLSAVTFMDCGGYGGLVKARLRLESDGRVLTVLNFRGQPKRFLAMIEGLGLQAHRHSEVRREVGAVDAS